MTTSESEREELPLRVHPLLASGPQGRDGGGGAVEEGRGGKNANPAEASVLSSRTTDPLGNAGTTGAPLLFLMVDWNPDLRAHLKHYSSEMYL